MDTNLILHVSQFCGVELDTILT